MEYEGTNHALRRKRGRGDIMPSSSAGSYRDVALYCVWAHPRSMTKDSHYGQFGVARIAGAIRLASTGSVLACAHLRQRSLPIRLSADNAKVSYSLSIILASSDRCWRFADLARA